MTRRLSVRYSRCTFHKDGYDAHVRGEYVCTVYRLPDGSWTFRGARGVGYRKRGDAVNGYIQTMPIVERERTGIGPGDRV